MASIDDIARLIAAQQSGDQSGLDNVQWAQANGFGRLGSGQSARPARGHPAGKVRPPLIAPGWQDRAKNTMVYGLMSDAWDAFTAPKRAYTGEMQVMDPQTGNVSDEAVQNMAELAGMVTLGAGAVPAQKNTLRAGASIIPNKPKLMAHHNISEKGLGVADEIGGLPMPSIAISSVDDPLMKFGDITLVGPEDMAKPSRANKVYVGDAYTGRQPRGEVVIKNKQAVQKAMASSPDFGHTKDASYYLDRFDNVEDANEKLQMIQLAIKSGNLNPADFSDMLDMERAARKAVGYSDEIPQMRGLAAFRAETEKVLPRGFTYSGTRRKPKPYTLDNVMKEMKGAHAQGSENFNYGPSSFRANQLSPVDNFSGVKAARGRVMPEEQTKAAYDAFTQRYDDLVAKIADFSGDKDFGAYDRASEFMPDFASGKGREWKGASWVDNMGDDFKKEIAELAGKARDLPVNYMEAKPKRAVGLNEFKGAIVPAGSEKTIEVLKRHGIDRIYQYASPEERVSLLQKFPELQFMVPAAGVTGVAAALMNSQADAFDKKQSFEQAYAAGNGA